MRAIRTIRPLPLLLTAALALGLSPAALAQPAPHGKTPRAGELSKVAPDLLEVRELRRMTPAERAAAAPPGPFVKGLPPLVEGKARVEVRLDGLDEAALAQLRALGLEIESHSFAHGRASGRLDLERLERLAALPQVRRIVPVYPPRTSGGAPVLTEGAAPINANPFDTADVQQVLSLDGTGSKVGIISDSLHIGLGGFESGGACTCTSPGDSCLNEVSSMTNQNTGELPPTIEVIEDLASGGSDEGSALGEIVFDMATQAELMFATAFSGDEVGFAANIDKLVNCGATVIVDDVQYFSEPMFQDGLVAQAAQAAAEAGVSYHAAAGNQATYGIDDFYDDSNPGVDNTSFPPTGDDLHDFLPGGGVDTFAAVTIPGSPSPSCENTMEGLDFCCGVAVVLQWAEPFDAPLGPGASSDLDLHFYANCTTPGDPSSCSFNASSASPQGCGDPATPGCDDGVCQDPLEILTIRNLGAGSASGFFAVEHFCGDESLELRIATFPVGICNGGAVFPGLYNFEDGGAGENPIFVDPQIYGHAAADGVVAVAATRWNVLNTVEAFSSLGGPLPFYFDGSGTMLPSVETHFKPNVTAPDGVSTTTPGFNPFFGTSAAAPHAAALAALAQQATGHNISAYGLKAILEQTIGIDLLPTGLDDRAGHGLIDALRSAGTVATTAPMTYVSDLMLDLNGFAFVLPSPSNRVKIRASNSITYADGDFSNIEAMSPLHIFADGFESGDTSSWSGSTP